MARTIRYELDAVYCAVSNNMQRPSLVQEQTSHGQYARARGTIDTAINSPFSGPALAVPMDKDTKCKIHVAFIAGDGSSTAAVPPLDVEL